MDEARRETGIKGLPFWWRPRLLAGAAALLATAFAVLVLFDRALAGILFLAGFAVLLEGLGQFHPLFALLFPLLALAGAVTDASRGQPGAGLRWFLGAAVIFALGRVLRRHRVAPTVRPNPALETLTAELAALKARRDRGEITDEEFQGRRDAAVGVFRQAFPNSPAATGTSGTP